jgi:hypothetical protein
MKREGGKVRDMYSKYLHITHVKVKRHEMKAPEIYASTTIADGYRGLLWFGAGWMALAGT